MTLCHCIYYVEETEKNEANSTKFNEEYAKNEAKMTKYEEIGT